MDRLNKEIVRLSGPAIISNVTVPLLGLCDTAISGHLGSELYLAAIAVGSVMLNVVFWLFGFLRAGTTGLTATAFGSDDEYSIKQVFSRALTLALVGGSILIIIQKPLMGGLLWIIDAEPGVTAYVERYFSICIWGAPAILGVMAISGWFVGMQSTVFPMAIAIIVNIINIGLSFLYVFGLKWGFEGVAWGTLCANWTGLIIAYICALWYRKGKGLWCKFTDIIKGGGLNKFFAVNVNLFFRSACIIGVSLGVASAGARLGALTLAVNVIVMQLFQFFSFFMDGFAFSAEALVGKFYGSGDEVMVKKSVIALLKWTLSVAVVFTAIYAFCCVGISKILTDQQSAWTGINELRIWIALIPIVSCWAFIYDGFYIGVTSTGKMMTATFVATIVFYIIAFIHYDGDRLTTGIENNKELWSAFLAYLLLRGVILSVRWKNTLQERIIKRN